MNDRRIEYLPLGSLQPHPRNPKDHDIGEICRSIRRFGFNDAVIIDERTGRLVSGHGRVEALRALQRDMQGDPPAGVKKDTASADWTVPVQRGWASKDDTEAEAFIIAANRLVEIGGYNDANLEAVLKDLAVAGALDGIGYDADDVEQLLAAAAARDLQPKAGADEIPSVITPRAKPGDLFALGRHRLLCGSSTEAADVRRLLGDVKPHLMVTDPPYGVEYDPGWRDAAGINLLGDAQNKGKVENDDRADWTDAWRLFPGEVAYVWHGGLHAATVMTSLLAAGFEMRAQIVWAKPALVFGRGHYHWQHEPCWYAVRKGGTGHWSGDRKQSTLWEIAGMNPMGGSRAKEDAKTGHGTQKPVECMKRPIENNSQPGDAVYEPFSGSGSTIIAGEMTGRAVFAMELNPAYVDLALARWEAFTGQKATLL